MKQVGNLSSPPPLFSRTQEATSLNPNALLSSQILDGILQSQTNAGTSSLTHALVDGKTSDLGQTFDSLTEPERNNIILKFGEGNLHELISISEETDSKIFFASLNQFGQGLLNQDRVSEAMTVFSAILETAPENFATIRESAKKNLDAIRGDGSFGMRLEFLGRRFIGDTMSPLMWGTFAGAQFLSGLGKLAIATRLGALPATSLLAHPWAVQGISSTVGFAVEVPAFVGIGHGLNKLVRNSQTVSNESLLQELKVTALNLGSMRFAHFTGQTIAAGLGNAIKADAFTALSQKIMAPASMLGGIYLGKLAESHYHLENESDQATLLCDSLVMFFQFKGTDYLTQSAFGPRWEKFNQRLQHETQMAIQHNMGWLTKSIAGDHAVGVGPNGELLPIPTQQLGEELIFKASSMPAEESGGGHIPPTPSPTQKSPRFEKVLPATRSIQPYPTRDPSFRIGSSREGIQRSQNRGLDEHALAFLRMAGNQLRDFPELREEFFEHVRNILGFMKAQQETLDPIQKGMPHYAREELNRLRGEFNSALSTLAPESGRYFAEYLLFDASTRGLKTAEDFQKLDEAAMVDLGIEPKARDAIMRNAQAYSPKMIQEILSHPLLRDTAESSNPATAKLIETYDSYQQGLAELASQVEILSPELKLLRDQLKQTKNAEEQLQIEDVLSRKADDINTKYWHDTGRLSAAMNTFLKNPLHANVMLIEIRRRSGLIRALQDANPQLLRDVLLTNFENLRGDAAKVTDEFFQAMFEMDIVTDRNPLSRLYHGIARLVGKDPHSPRVVRRRVDQAIINLIQKIPLDFWQFQSPDAESLSRTQELGINFFRQRHQMTHQVLRPQFRELEPTNDQHWKNEEKVQELWGNDVAFQIRHAQAILGKVRKQIGEEEFTKIFGSRYQKISQEAEQAIALYQDPKKRGNNSRRINRRVEIMNEKANELRQLVREAIALAQTILPSEKLSSLPNLNFEGISALMMPYVMKKDSSLSIHPGDGKSKITKKVLQGEHPGIVFRHVIPTMIQSYRFFKSMNGKESMAEADAIFLEYNRSRAIASGSHAVADRNVDHLVESEPIVTDTKHNSWDDFLRGGVPNDRAAQLRERATDRDNKRIGAKKGLDKKVPVAGPAMAKLTEPIADAAIEFDGSVTNLALAMAYGDFPGNRLGPRSASVFSELTMPVPSQIGPYVWDPFPSTSTILDPPVGGRSFAIADRAMALTAQHQDILVDTVLNTYRLWPKPDSPLPLREGPTTIVTELWPYLALAEGEKSMMRHLRPGPTRGNWLRTLWLLQGGHPDYQRPVSSVEEIFAPYTRAQSPEIEKAIQENFPGLVERVLYPKTREALKTKLVRLDQLLEVECDLHPNVPKAKGLRRWHRIVRARIKLLDQVEQKVARGENLTLAERKFVQKTAAALGEGENISGTDRILEQVDYYLSLKSERKNLNNDLLKLQEDYYHLVKEWNEARKDPTRPEHQQVHVSEAEGYQETWNQYRIALETIYNLEGITPARWEGEVFPDLIFRRENQDLVIEPRDWQAAQGLSRSALWKFFLDDTIGIVQLAKTAKDFDPTPDLYLTLHRAWGHRALNTNQTRIRLQNTKNIINVANVPSIIAPTHDSGLEFPILPSILHDFGLKTFFVADRKFFDPFWGTKTFSIFGKEYAIPFPQGPAYGLIRALLGPMDQYGHLSINREDRQGARQTMVDTGNFLNEKRRSIIVYPGGTRNEVQYRVGKDPTTRYEGSIYGSKTGVAATMDASRAPIIPIGLINGGIIFPKQPKDAFLIGGARMGLDYRIRFGDPIFYDKVISDNPTPAGIKLRKAIPPILDEQYQKLTGRPITARAQSKADKVKQQEE